MVLKKGKVSCIVTTYERPIEILKKAIMSIVKQTYDNYEILIVNDSPKNIELSNKIKHLVKLIKNEYCIEITYLLIIRKEQHRQSHKVHHLYHQLHH